MEIIRSTLFDLLNKKGFYEKILELDAVEIYNDLVKNQFSALKESKAVGINKGLLTVHAPDSVLNYEVFVHKRALIQKINQILGKKLVNDIIVRIGG